MNEIKNKEDALRIVEKAIYEISDYNPSIAKELAQAFYYFDHFTEDKNDTGETH